MATKLFVGALSYSMTDEELSALFAAVGTVNSARIITDRDSQMSKGFGFVEMADDDEAQTAIKELNNKEVAGRQISVSVARPMTDRPSRPGAGGRGRF